MHQTNTSIPQAPGIRNETPGVTRWWGMDDSLGRSVRFKRHHVDTRQILCIKAGAQESRIYSEHWAAMPVVHYFGVMLCDYSVRWLWCFPITGVQEHDEAICLDVLLRLQDCNTLHAQLWTRRRQTSSYHRRPILPFRALARVQQLGMIHCGLEWNNDGGEAQLVLA